MHIGFDIWQSIHHSEDAVILPTGSIFERYVRKQDPKDFCFHKKCYLLWQWKCIGILSRKECTNKCTIFSGCRVGLFWVVSYVMWTRMNCAKKRKENATVCRFTQLHLIWTQNIYSCSFKANHYLVWQVGLESN